MTQCNPLAPLLLALFGLVDQPDTAEDLARSLESKAIESKERIKKGHVLLKTVHTKADDVRMHTEVLYDMYFSGASLRSVAEYRAPKGTSFARVAIGERDYVFDDGGAAPAETGKVSDLKPGGLTRSRMADAFDPRTLGMAPVPVPGNFSQALRTVFWFKDLRPSDVSRDTVDGEECWKIVYRVKNPDREVRLWIAPRFGYGVIRHELERAGAEGRPGFTIGIKTRYADFDGVWFPKEVKYSLVKSGDTTLEQVTTVDRADFKTPVDPKLFGPALLGLSPGRAVLGPGRKALVWDGKTLKDQAAGPAQKPEAGQNKNKRPFAMILYANAAVCTVIAAWMLLKHRKSRTSGNP